MDGSVTTRQEFEEAAVALVRAFSREVWDQVVEGSAVARADEWVKERGGRLLRAVLGAALSAWSERGELNGPCSCGGRVRFRQHRTITLHTVVAGREVTVRARYGQCRECHRGQVPLRQALKADAEGYTDALQELALRAAVIEPYEEGRGELLERFAGVTVSAHKLHALVAREGQRAQPLLEQQRAAPERRTAAAIAPEQPGPCYVAIDGGMVPVERRWQEAKRGCVFEASSRVAVSRGRHALVHRQVVAVRGGPAALAQRLWPRAQAAGVEGARRVVVLGDGAVWIWNLAAELFPNRVEILDWYHADEHVSATARILYGEGTERAKQWRQEQLNRLWDDRVDELILLLRFLRAHPRRAAKRAALEDLSRYLTTHRERMRYRTFREAGYLIGSGPAESAVSDVVQPRMKPPGMRWKPSGADAMLAMRSVYRSTGLWQDFWSCRAA